MDKHQLVTIATTAAISVIVREIFGWLVAWAKIRSTTDTAKANIKKIFSKSNRRIIWDALWFLNAIGVLWWEIKDRTPITRLDIVLISFFTANLFFWLIVVAWHVFASIRIYRELRKSTQV